MPAELDAVPISTLADVNPSRKVLDLRPDSEVSFIPMQDVSEGGEWTGHQIRRFSVVRAGYTPFLEGDVLFAKITPCMENGKGAHARGLLGGVGFGSTEFHVLRARSEVNDRFIYHWSRSPALRLKAQAFMIGSAGQQRVQSDFFDHFLVPLLHASVQRRIAAILDTLDDAIRRTEHVIAKLQQMKRGLLHDLLTRGVDEDGELRPPQSEAPHLYKDSPLGRIPRGWTYGSFSDFRCPDRALIKTGPFGTAMAGRSWADAGVPVITIGSLGENAVIAENLLFLSDRDAKDFTAYELRTGDVVFSRVADVGRSLVITESESGWIMSSNLMRISLDQSRAVPTYLHLAILYSNTRQQIRQLANAGAREVVNTTILSKLNFVWAPKPEQVHICAVVAGYEARAEVESQVRQQLMQLKSGLLYDLLTGRVRVPLPAEMPA